MLGSATKHSVLSPRTANNFPSGLIEVFCKSKYVNCHQKVSFLRDEDQIVTGISVDDTHIDRPIILETTKRSKIFSIKNPNLGIIICCDDSQRPTVKVKVELQIKPTKISNISFLRLDAYLGLR